MRPSRALRLAERSSRCRTSLGSDGGWGAGGGKGGHVVCSRVCFCRTYPDVHHINQRWTPRLVALRFCVQALFGSMRLSRFFFFHWVSLMGVCNSDRFVCEWGLPGHFLFRSTPESTRDSSRHQCRTQSAPFLFYNLLDQGEALFENNIVASRLVLETNGRS